MKRWLEFSHRNFELIFCLLTNTNGELEAMFQVLPKHFELTFCPFCSPKYEFNQVKKTMFQVVPGTAN